MDFKFKVLLTEEKWKDWHWPVIGKREVRNDFGYVSLLGKAENYPMSFDMLGLGDLTIATIKPLRVGSVLKVSVESVED